MQPNLFLRDEERVERDYDVMKKEIIISSEEGLPQAAREFVAATGCADSRGSRIFAFTGSMGVGKTTFISAVCRALGVDEDAVSSPTFAIVNEYRTAGSAEAIYHFDCYRIEEDEEALDMGIEDYFDSGALCFIEWPDRIERFLPDDTVEVKIDVLEDGSRRVSF